MTPGHCIYAIGELREPDGHRREQKQQYSRSARKPAKARCVHRLAADLSVKLADRPAGTQSFGLVKAASLLILYGEQLDVGRPGQWQSPSISLKLRGITDSPDSVWRIFGSGQAGKMHAFAKDSLDQNHGRIGVSNPQTIVRFAARHSQRAAPRVVQTLRSVAQCPNIRAAMIELILRAAADRAALSSSTIPAWMLL
jgi:hypothetical protein